MLFICSQIKYCKYFKVFCCFVTKKKNHNLPLSLFLLFLILIIGILETHVSYVSLHSWFFNFMIVFIFCFLYLYIMHTCQLVTEKLLILFLTISSENCLSRLYKKKLLRFSKSHVSGWKVTVFYGVCWHVWLCDWRHSYVFFF